MQHLDIKDTNVAANLSVWCSEQLSNSDWDLQLMSLSPTWYRFKFKDPQIATLSILNS